MTDTHYSKFNILKNARLKAIAYINGNHDHPGLNGIVRFFETSYEGIIVEAEIYHLPDSVDDNPNTFFGFHIHENGDCSDSFQNTGGHYNPSDSSHPYHAGDMPPLMSNDGYAWMVFFDARVTIPEILGKSVVIHQMPDDFTTQPSGDSGEKIACGVIAAL